MKTPARMIALSMSSVLISAAACDKRKEMPSSTTGSVEGVASQNMGQPPTPPGAPRAPSATGSRDADTELKVTWTDPANWKKVGGRTAMRKATYQIPPTSGDSEPAEMAVFYFGPQDGGGIDANVSRWVNQFKDVDPASIQRSDRSVNGLTQHVVEIPIGSYNPGMGQPGPKNDYALLGAVIETPSGLYFLKLTGPKHTVSASRAAFFGLLDSMKPTS